MTAKRTYSYFKITDYFGWFFLIVSVLILLYTYYKAEIIYDGSRGYIYTKYYIFSFVSILFWGAVLKSNKIIKQNIILITIGSIFALYLIEIVLNFMPEKTHAAENTQKLRLIEAEKLNIKFDTRSKYQVYEDLLLNNISAVPSIHAQEFRETNGIPGNAGLFPLAGISNRKTVYCNENGQYTIYSSDRYGFNNPDSVWENKVSTVLIGDSFAHGACVGVGQDISSQLRIMSKKNIINLGYGSNGPLVELATLVEYAKQIKPKNVFWLYFERNDLNDLILETQSSLLMSYLNGNFTQGLINKQSEINDSLYAYIKMKEKNRNKTNKANKKQSEWFWKMQLLRFTNIRKMLRFDSTKVDYGETQMKTIFPEILLKAKKITNSWGGKMYFVYLPSFLRYSTNNASNVNFHKRNEVLKIVSELNIPVIDIHDEVFSKVSDPLKLFPYKIQGHYTAEGYKMISAKISRKIAN